MALSVVDVARRHAAVHQRQPIFSVISIAVKAVIQEVSGGIVAVCICRGAILWGSLNVVVGVETVLWRRSGTGRHVLLHTVAEAVVFVVETLSGFAGSGQASEIIIAVSPVSGYRVIAGVNIAVRCVAKAEAGNKSGTDGTVPGFLDNSTGTALLLWRELQNAKIGVRPVCPLVLLSPSFVYGWYLDIGFGAENLDPTDRLGRESIRVLFPITAMDLDYRTGILGASLATEI